MFGFPTEEVPLRACAKGFSDLDYDRACGVQLFSAPGSPDYLAAVDETQRIVASWLPSIPFYLQPRNVVHRPELCGLEPNLTAFGALWNLEDIRPCG